MAFKAQRGSLKRGGSGGHGMDRVLGMERRNRGNFCSWISFFLMVGGAVGP